MSMYGLVIEDVRLVDDDAECADGIPVPCHGSDTGYLLAYTWEDDDERTHWGLYTWRCSGAPVAADLRHFHPDDGYFEEGEPVAQQACLPPVDGLPT